MLRLEIAFPAGDVPRSKLGPLAERVARIIREGNRRGALAGLDADDEAYRPLKASTIEAGRPGDGPPLAPREEASRIVKNFRIRTTITNDRIKLTIYWPGMPFLRFHVTGTKYMARRDPVGIRPQEFRQIQGVVGKVSKGATFVVSTY